jgi:membrane protein
MKWYQKVIETIKTGNIDKVTSGKNHKTHWLLQPFIIVWNTGKGIGEHEVMLRSAALTIYTVMSLVPIVALIFGILKGFGFDQNLTDYLYSLLPQYTNVIDTVMIFVNRTLERTRGGVIAAVGVVVLLWSVIKVFGNIEDAFNSIWEVKKGRAMARKFSDYIAVIFIAPILLTGSISLGTFIQNFLSFLDNWFVSILLGLASMILIWVLFSFIYWMMPNTKVKLKGAIIAGIMAGTVFYLFSLFYIYVQSGVSSYNAIYGTFAAIPLFLAWMQISWQIVLVGCELSFAYQNTGRYEQEKTAGSMDFNHRRKVLLATMLCIGKHYQENKGGISSEEIADELNLPIRVIRDMIYKLLNGKMIVAVKNEKDSMVNLYVPARNISTIKVSDVIDCMENASLEPDFSKIPAMEKVNSLLDDMKKKAYSPELDVYLTELINA